MNKEQNNISDDLLVKYLLGEADTTEQQAVEQWIAASEANKKYFADFRLIWDKSKLVAAQSNVNEQEAWARFVQRTQREELIENNTPQHRTIPLFQRTWLRAAALLVVLAGVGWLAYTMANKDGQMMLAQSGDNTLTDTLPDGSVVVLNKHSSLTYPSKFNGDKRMVTLTGEAFFSITPNKQQPFIIDANSNSVTVVGTTFNVKTSADITEVIVETGIVQVAKKQKSVQVLPHQKATVVKDKDAPETETNTDELYNYYRTKEFVCKATPLRKFVAVLNEAYNVHIVITDTKLAEVPLTATFKDEPLDNILKVIKETLNITIAHKGRDILLSPAVKSEN